MYLSDSCKEALTRLKVVYQTAVRPVAKSAASDTHLDSVTKLPGLACFGPSTCNQERCSLREARSLILLLVWLTRALAACCRSRQSRSSHSRRRRPRPTAGWHCRGRDCTPAAAAEASQQRSRTGRSQQRIRRQRTPSCGSLVGTASFLTHVLCLDRMLLTYVVAYAAHARLLPRPADHLPRLATNRDWAVQCPCAAENCSLTASCHM